MKQVLQSVWKTDRRSFLMILFLDIAVGMLSGISIVMLVPMLDLLEISVGDGGALQWLLRPFAALTYLQRAGVIMGIFVILLLLRALCSRWAAIRKNAYLEQYELSLRKQLYDALRHAGWETLAERPGSELTNLFISQCWQARTCLSSIIALLSSVFSAVVQLAIALWMSLPLTLLVLAVGCLFLALFWPLLKKSKEYGRKYVEISRAMYQEIQNQLNSIKEIRAYGVETEHAARFDQISQDYYDTSLKTTQLKVMPQLCYSVAAAVMLALAFVVSVLLMDTGTAQLVVLVYVFSRLWPMFSSWQGQLQSIQSYIPAYETVCAARESLSQGLWEPETRDGVLPFTREVAFDRVSFTYQNGSEAVLQDVSFTLPFGTVTALAGASGAGKSTTADLLLGLLQPTGGHILVDGKPLDPEDRGLWRRAIGYIPQDPLILGDTVRENLLRFHPGATEEEMIDALKRSMAWGFVEKLPQGLDTMLGDKGVRLSGGERQRVVLARVLMGNPRLIILDEATSALDYESETFIRETIRSLQGNTTVLIIAHRLATIRGAERAIVLEGGHIAEQGDLAELLSRSDGYLSRMVSVE